MYRQNAGSILRTPLKVASERNPMREIMRVSSYKWWGLCGSLVVLLAFGLNLTQLFFCNLLYLERKIKPVLLLEGKGCVNVNYFPPKWKGQDFAPAMEGISPSDTYSNMRGCLEQLNSGALKGNFVLNIHELGLCNWLALWLEAWATNTRWRRRNGWIFRMLWFLAQWNRQGES